ELVVQHLHHGGKTVGRAGGVGDDVVLRAVVEVTVDPDAEGDVGIFRRGGNDDFLRSGFEVFAGTGLVEEKPGRLENNVDAFATPVEVGGVTLGRGHDAVTVHGDGLVIILNRAVKTPRGGVILEKVRE